MLTAEQKKSRKLGIGGSDAAAICGVSKYRTPMDVYLDKISDDIEEEVYNPIFERGNILESHIIHAFEKLTALKVQVPSETFYHPKYPFILANLDGVVANERTATCDTWIQRECGDFENYKFSSAYDGFNIKALLEVKTSNIWTKDFHMGNIPDDYYAQVQHYMAVTGLPKAYIAVLSADESFFNFLVKMAKGQTSLSLSLHLNDEIEIFEVERNEEVISRMIELEKTFWEEHVLKRIPPDATSLGDIRSLFSKGEENKKVVATKDIIFHVEKRRFYLNEMKITEDLIETHQHKIMEFMGDASSLLNESGDTIVTWKNQSRKSLDTSRLKEEKPDVYSKFQKEYHSRVFRVLKPLEMLAEKEE